MSATIETSQNLTKTNPKGILGFYAFNGTTGGPANGVFYFTDSMGFDVLAVSGLAVSEGGLGHTHIGDAVFEVLSMNWSADGDVHAVIGTWNRKDFQKDGTRNPYTRDMAFTASLSYVTP